MGTFGSRRYKVTCNEKSLVDTRGYPCLRSKLNFPAALDDGSLSRASHETGFVLPLHNGLSSPRTPITFWPADFVLCRFIALILTASALAAQRTDAAVAAEEAPLSACQLN